MEIGYQLVHYVKPVSRTYHDLRLGVQSVLFRLVKIRQDIAQRLFRRDGIIVLVRRKLRNTQLSCGTDKIQTFQCPHTRCTHCHNMS